MADDLPPSLRASADLPPSLQKAGGDVPPSLRQDKSFIQKVAGASEVPVRGLRGIGVGTERLIAGDRPQEALERASEATQPGYKPKPGEKIGAFSGEMLDPRFMLFGGAGEKLAVTGLGKAVAGGAAALGGVKALEETEETGHPTVEGTGTAAAVGAAGGAVLYGAVKAIAPVAENAIQFIKKVAGKSDPISFGNTVKAGEKVADQMASGKTIPEIAKEMQAGTSKEPGIGASGTPTSQPQTPTGQTPPGQVGTSGGTEEAVNAVFPGPDPSHSSITGNPEYHKMRQEATDIVNRYAKARGVTPDNKFANNLWQELHDELGRIMRAAPADRPGIIKEIGSKYPTIEKDFMVLKDQLYSDKTGPIYFDRNIKGQRYLPEAPAGPDKVLEKALTQAADKFEKSKPYVVETSLLPTVEKAVKGDQSAQLNVFRRTLAKFYASPTAASSTAANLFKRRYSEIALGNFESHLFARDTLKGLSDVERQAIPFILEKQIPEAEKFMHPKKDQILGLAKGFMESPEKFPQLKTAVDKIGAYLDEGHNVLKQMYDDIGFRENYINHIWDKPPQISGGGPGKGSLSQYNPFSKERFIASYAEGINQGLTPKTLDVMDLLKVYDNYKVKAVANARFVEELQKIRVEGNLPAVMPADKAPSDWQLIDNSALNKKRLIPGKNGEPGVFMSQAVRVSPEVAPAVRAIIERPFASVDPGPHAGFIEKAFHNGVNAYEYLNSITKKLRLSLSFFHHYSLTETTALTGSPLTPLRVLGREAKQILSDGGMNPGELYKAFMEGHPAYNNVPLAKDALAHGISLGPIGDVQSTRFTQLLSDTEGALRKITPIQKGLHALRTFNDVWDKALWDYYYSGLKLDLYERQVQKNILKFGDKVPMEQIKRDTADFINKAAGGSLETLMTSPRYKQAMQWALLAPDWTLGRLQLFGSVFKGGVQGSMGRKFWLKAALAYATMIDSWNYVNTAKAGLKGPNGEDGRHLWQNEEGKKLHLFWDKDDNGRNEYILPAKAVTEVVGWVFEPIKTLGHKLSPTVQIMVEAFTGHTVGGYEIPPEDKTIGGFLRRYEMPISMGKTNVFMTFPRSKGMSKTSVIQMMQRGYESNNTDMIGSAMSWAIENGFDAKALQGIAYRNYRSTLKKNLLK